MSSTPYSLGILPFRGAVNLGLLVTPSNISLFNLLNLGHVAPVGVCASGGGSGGHCSIRANDTGTPAPKTLPESLFILCGAEPTNSVTAVSGEQRRHTATHIHGSTPPAPHPSRLARDAEQSSLGSTAGPCWFSILKTAVRTRPSQSPYLSLPPTSLRAAQVHFLRL